jgi:hypothetical protein
MIYIVKNLDKIYQLFLSTFTYNLERSTYLMPELTPKSDSTGGESKKKKKKEKESLKKI